MKRKIVLLLLLSVAVFSVQAQSVKRNTKKNQPVEVSDRQYWADLLYKISAPVLENLSKGELKKNMVMEYSPNWDGRNKNVAYLEAFGRLMAGVAPWLALPDDDTAEGKQRKQLREWALKSYAQAVDPESPDYMHWKGTPQVLVDAAYVAVSFIRAPKALWEPLDEVTKQRYVKEFQSLKWVSAPYNNWLMFRATIEAFLVSVGESYDAFAVLTAMHKLNDWYVGDGFYSDGADFAMDYYNSFVIHPMIVESAEVLKNNRKPSPIGFQLALQRMQRYNILLERMISPEGTFPPVGRSLTYRTGALQTLGLAAWKYGLPTKEANGKTLTNGQVRGALTAATKRVFSDPSNFNEGGYLTLGFVGHAPYLADYYSNNGSMYLTSLGFLPLGLPADHPFWTDPVEEWTSQKAWSGKEFPKDGHESIRVLKPAAK